MNNVTFFKEDYRSNSGGNSRGSNIRPATLRQIEKIKEKVTELGINIPSREFFDKLTAEAADKLIKNLIEKQNEQRDNQPPTENMVRKIVRMFYCPDCDFEELGIPYRIYKDEYIEVNGQRIQKWSSPTAPQIAKKLMNDLTYKECQEFIRKYNAAYTEWERTRITIRQANYIRHLEKQLEQYDRPQVENIAFDFNGDEIIMIDPRAKHRESQTFYQKLSDDQLRMMSKEIADEYISQLEKEIKDKRLSTGFTDMEYDVTFESLRYAKKANDYAVQELVKLRNVMYQIQAAAGIDNDEIFDAIPYADEIYDRSAGVDDLFFDKHTTLSKHKKNKIASFLHFIVEEKILPIKTVLAFLSDSELGMEIFTDAY